MTRVLVVAALAALGLSPATSSEAAHDRPIPVHRAAHAGDGFARGAETQFWRLRAADRRGRRVVAITLWAGSEPRALVEVYNPRLQGGFDYRSSSGVWGTRAKPSGRGMKIVGPRGEVARLDRTKRTWRFRTFVQGATADVRLVALAPGVEAGPWTLAREGEARRPAVIRWATPAPLARVRLKVQTPAGVTKFRSARGYLDHTWGTADLDQEAWDDWGHFQVWRGGRSMVMHGLVNSWDVSGSASGDPMFRGVLVHAARRRTTVCRPFVQWHSLPRPGNPAVRARCGGRTVALARRSLHGSPYFGGEQKDYWARETTFARFMRRPYGIGTIEWIDHRRCLETC